jgi:hypothetical protein
MTSSNPKIMDKPKAISAMIKPNTRPLMAKTAIVLLMIFGSFLS